MNAFTNENNLTDDEIEAMKQDGFDLDDDLSTEGMDRGDTVGDHITDDDDDDDPIEIDEQIEPEAQGEQEEQEEPQAQGEQDDEEQRKPIPYPRFKEVNGRLRDSESENAELRERLRAYEEKGSAPAPEPAPAPVPEPSQTLDDIRAQIEESQQKANQYFYEGENELLEAEQRRFRELNEQLADVKADMRAARQYEQMQQKQAQTLVDETVEYLTATYSQLDPKSKDYDPLASAQVQAVATHMYQNDKVPYHKALEAATNHVMGVTPPPTPASKQQQNMLRNHQRSQQIPPVPQNGLGQRQQLAEQDFSREAMSDDDFDAMSEADKKRARGDYL